MGRLRTPLILVGLFMIMTVRAVMVSTSEGHHLPVWIGVMIAGAGAGTIFYWASVRQRHGLEQAVRTENADEGVRAVLVGADDELSPGFLLVCGPKIVWCPGEPTAPAVPVMFWTVQQETLNLYQTKIKVGLRRLAGVRVEGEGESTATFAVLRGSVSDWLTVAGRNGFHVVPAVETSEPADNG